MEVEPCLIGNLGLQFKEHFKSWRGGYQGALLPQIDSSASLFLGMRTFTMRHVLLARTLVLLFDDNIFIRHSMKVLRMQVEN